MANMIEQSLLCKVLDTMLLLSLMESVRMILQPMDTKP